jgi:hypothetical protein
MRVARSARHCDRTHVNRRALCRLVAVGDTQAMALLEGTANAQLLTSTAAVP